MRKDIRITESILITFIMHNNTVIDYYVIPSIIIHDCAGCAGIHFVFLNFKLAITKLKN